MSIILRRLNHSFSLSLEGNYERKELENQIRNVLSHENRTQLVLEHAKINLEYNVLCSKIANEFYSNPDELREQMEAALKTAELLEVIYEDYLVVPREIKRLKEEQRALREWLNLNTKKNKNKSAEKTYASETIRGKTSLINLPRLFTVRLRRLLIAISVMTSATSDYHQTISKIDSYLGPALSNLAWLYFIPRIADNLAMTIKHTVSHPWMSKEEKELGWQTRLRIQFNSRWQDLSNDIPWMIGNTLGCFVFVGSLLPYAIVLTLALQFYEVIQSYAIYRIEIDNLEQQRQKYQELLNNSPRDSKENKQINDYLNHLDTRIAYEKKRVWLSLRTALILMVAISLAIPFFSPTFAVIGASIAVLITIHGYLARKELEKQKPSGSQLFGLLNKITTPSPKTEDKKSTTLKGSISLFNVCNKEPTNLDEEPTASPTTTLLSTSVSSNP